MDNSSKEFITKDEFKSIVTNLSKTGISFAMQKQAGLIMDQAEINKEVDGIDEAFIDFIFILSIKIRKYTPILLKYDLLFEL